MKITVQGATADALQDDLIGDLVPPRDATNTAKAPHVIAVNFVSCRMYVGQVSNL